MRLLVFVKTFRGGIFLKIINPNPNPNPKLAKYMSALIFYS